MFGSWYRTLMKPVYFRIDNRLEQKYYNGSTMYHLVVSLNRYIEKGTESKLLSGTLNQLYIYKRVIVNIRNNPSQRFIIIICQIHSLLHIFHVGYVLFLIHLSTESLSARIYLGYILRLSVQKKLEFRSIACLVHLTSHHITQKDLQNVVIITLISINLKHFVVLFSKSPFHSLWSVLMSHYHHHPCHRPSRTIIHRRAWSKVSPPYVHDVRMSRHPQVNSFLQWYMVHIPIVGHRNGGVVRTWCWSNPIVDVPSVSWVYGSLFDISFPMTTTFGW